MNEDKKNQSANYETDSISGLFELAKAFCENQDTEGLKMIENLSIHCLKNHIGDSRSDYIALSEFAESCFEFVKTKNNKALNNIERLKNVITEDLKD